MKADTRVRNESMADLYQAGGTLAEIGDLVGLSRERVRQILSHLDVDRRPIGSDPSEETVNAARLVLAADGAVSIRQASKEYDANESNVSRYLQAHHSDFDYRSKRKAFYKATTPHGTFRRYLHYGCRCDDCRAANTARCMAWQKEAAKRTPPDHVHGTTGGYSNWGCRCEACTEANSVACREWKERQKADA